MSSLALERRPRVRFIDALKVLALLQMVAGHTLDAVLVEPIRHSAAYGRYGYVRGLVSVAFFVSAGLAYHVTTLTRFEAHRADPAARMRRVRRAVALIALGYVVHSPFGLFSSDPSTVAHALTSLARIDTLHCVGASLLLLEWVVAVSRTGHQARVVALVIAALLLAVAPTADLLSPTLEDRWVTQWVTHRGGSLFPVTPWAAYVLLGAASGSFFLPAERRGPFDDSALRIACASALAFALAKVLYVRWFDVAGVAASSRPSFFFEKLGYVLLAMAVLAALFRGRVALPAAMQTLSGETLVVYVFHIGVLFWHRLSPGRSLARSLELPSALGLAFCVVALSSAVGLAAPALRARARRVFGARLRPIALTAGSERKEGAPARR